MTSRHHAPLFVGLLFVLMGLLVGTGGVWLIALGGSWFYLPGGLALVLIGLLLLQRSPAALWVHAALLMVTLAWSVWEAGLDWWAMAARGDVLFVLGLVMLSPWFRRGLEHASQPAARHGLSAALGAFAVVAVVSWLQGPSATQSRPFAQQSRSAIVSAAHAAPPVLAVNLSHPLASPAQSSVTPDEMYAAGSVRTADLRTSDAQAPGRTAPPATHTLGARRLSGADMWGLTVFDQLFCRISFQRLSFADGFAPAAPLHASVGRGARDLLLQADHPISEHAGALQARSGGAARTAAAAEDWRAGTQQASSLATPWAVDRVSQAVHHRPLLSPLGLPCHLPQSGIRAVLFGPPAVPLPSPARPMARQGIDAVPDIIVRTEEPATQQPRGQQATPGVQTLPNA